MHRSWGTMEHTHILCEQLLLPIRRSNSMLLLVDSHSTEFKRFPAPVSIKFILFDPQNSWWLPAKGVIEVGGGHSSDRGDSGEEERGGKQSHHSRQQRRVGASEGRRQPRHFVPQRFFKRVRVRASCFPFEAASPSAQVHNRRPHCCAIQQR